MDEQFNPGLQSISTVWKAVKAGESLEGEDARLAAILQEHQEYHEAWDNIETHVPPAPESGQVNPVAHAYFHLVVENQIALGQPPEVALAVQRLVRNGRDRHEAIHAVGYVLAGELHTILKNQTPFNQTRYVREIRRLR